MKTITVVHAVAGAGDALRRAAPEALAAAVVVHDGISRCAVNVYRPDKRAPITPAVPVVDDPPCDLLIESWTELSVNAVTAVVDQALAQHARLVERCSSFDVFERTMRRDIPREHTGLMPYTKLLSFLYLRPDRTLEDIKAIWLEHGEGAIRTMPPFEVYQQNIVTDRFAKSAPAFGGLGMFGFRDYDGFMATNDGTTEERLHLAAADFERWVVGARNIAADEYVALGKR